MKNIGKALISFFSRRKKSATNSNNDGIEREYTFVWYKRMETKNKIHYTQPFRTKIVAKSREEAKEKLNQFILGKMTVVIIDGDKYDTSEINNINKTFEKAFKEMNTMFEKLGNKNS
jgi:hypothetical protein